MPELNCMNDGAIVLSAQSRLVAAASQAAASRFASTPRRHGTVVATPSGHTSHAAKSEAGEPAESTQSRCSRWLPAHRWRLSLRMRKLLLWVHLLLINALCIGAWFGERCCAAACRLWVCCCWSLAQLSFGRHGMRVCCACWACCPRFPCQRPPCEAAACQRYPVPAPPPPLQPSPFTTSCRQFTMLRTLSP